MGTAREDMNWTRGIRPGAPYGWTYGGTKDWDYLTAYVGPGGMVGDGYYGRATDRPYGIGFEEDDLLGWNRPAFNVSTYVAYVPRGDLARSQPSRPIGQKEGRRSQAPNVKSFAGIGPKNYSRSDEAIYDDVCMVLMNDPEIDASQVEVKVENGVVTLSGEVYNRATKRLSERVIEDIRGVKTVQNDLRLQSEQRQS